MLSRKRIHGWMVGRFSFTASHAFLIPVRMYSRPRSGRTPHHPLSRIPYIQNGEPHFRHDSNEITAQYIRRKAPSCLRIKWPWEEKRACLWGISNRGFRFQPAGWNAGFREIVGGGRLYRLCCNNDVMEDIRERRVFPNTCPLYGIY